MESKFLKQGWGVFWLIDWLIANFLTSCSEISHIIHVETPTADEGIQNLDPCPGLIPVKRDVSFARQGSIDLASQPKDSESHWEPVLFRTTLKAIKDLFYSGPPRKLLRTYSIPDHTVSHWGPILFRTTQKVTEDLFYSGPPRKSLRTYSIPDHPESQWGPILFRTTQKVTEDLFYSGPPRKSMRT